MMASTHPTMAVALLSLSLFVVSCVNIGAPGRVPSQGQDRKDIAVASFDFSESELLGELYATVLEERGYPVRRITNLGSREIVQPALLQDMVDIVPEYVGTALSFVTLGRASVS